MLYSNLTSNNLGHLCFAGLDVVNLAKKYGTPAYIMDEDKIRKRCKIYVNALNSCFGKKSMPLFAGKALCFKELYRILTDENMGIDVVSSGEIFTAKEACFDMSKAFFHGNNKTKEDIDFAMDNRVGYFVCDNISELIECNESAKNHNIKQNVLLRITPGIDPHTHKKINTGKIDSKFGAAIETGQAKKLVEKCLSLQNLSYEGLHCHIGSQIFDCSVFVDAANIMIDFIFQISNEFKVKTNYLNLGGGMGVVYTEEDEKLDYSQKIYDISIAINKKCNRLNIDIPNILMEPGRSIVADSGITLYTVGNIKEIPEYKNYVSVDGGMTDNIRYALYESKYTIINASKCNLCKDYECSIAGRCCESGDLIQENVKISKPVKGDILAVLTTGAYNYSMASNYNAIPKAPIIMIKNGQDRVVVERQSYQDLISCQI